MERMDHARNEDRPPMARMIHRKARKASPSLRFILPVNGGLKRGPPDGDSITIASLLWKLTL
jgi:hypothetical protein